MAEGINLQDILSIIVVGCVLLYILYNWYMPRVESFANIDNVQDTKIANIVKGSEGIDNRITKLSADLKEANLQQIRLQTQMNKQREELLQQVLDAQRAINPFPDDEFTKYDGMSCAPELLGSTIYADMKTCASILRKNDKAISAIYVDGNIPKCHISDTCYQGNAIPTKGATLYNMKSRGLPRMTKFDIIKDMACSGIDNCTGKEWQPSRKIPGKSAEECARICDSDNKCVSFTVKDNECMISDNCWRGNQGIFKEKKGAILYHKRDIKPGDYPKECCPKPQVPSCVSTAKDAPTQPETAVLKIYGSPDLKGIATDIFYSKGAYIPVVPTPFTIGSISVAQGYRAVLFQEPAFKGRYIIAAGNILAVKEINRVASYIILMGNQVADLSNLYIAPEKMNEKSVIVNRLNPPDKFVVEPLPIIRIWRRGDRDATIVFNNSVPDLRVGKSPAYLNIDKIEIAPGYYVDISDRGKPNFNDGQILVGRDRDRHRRDISGKFDLPNELGRHASSIMLYKKNGDKKIII
jgi:hypothetical protein